LHPIAATQNKSAKKDSTLILALGFFFRVDMMIKKILKEKILVFDGAMGTMI